MNSTEASIILAVFGGFACIGLPITWDDEKARKIHLSTIAILIAPAFFKLYNIALFG